MIFQLFNFRLARKERDLRAAETRLKQYETEIADLKTRNETLVYDNNRKTDDNVVSDSLVLLSDLSDRVQYHI